MILIWIILLWGKPGNTVKVVIPQLSFQWCLLKVLAPCPWVQNILGSFSAGSICRSKSGWEHNCGAFGAEGHSCGWKELKVVLARPCHWARFRAKPGMVMVFLNPHPYLSLSLSLSLRCGQGTVWYLGCVQSGTTFSKSFRRFSSVQSSFGFVYIYIFYEDQFESKSWSRLWNQRIR